MSMNYYNPYDPYSGMFGYSPGMYNPYQAMADQGWAQIGNTATQNANQMQYWSGLLGQSAGDLDLKNRQFAWQQDLDRATQTGMWNGAYNMPSNQWFAGAFGTWLPNGPQAGQQTLQGQNQQFTQAQQLAAMYGQAFTPGGAGPAAGTQTQAAQQQAFAQNLANRQFGLAQQTQQQAAANQYLSLLASLRGPADWAKYQEVLGAGGSMNSLAAAAMGQYVPGGGATSGAQPQAANLNTLYGQVQGAAPTQQQQNQQLLGPQAQQFTQQQQQVYSPGQTWQQLAANAPGATNFQAGNEGWRQGNAWGAEYAVAQANAQNPQWAQQQQGPPPLPPAAGNGTNLMGAQAPGAPQANQMNLPAPNQVAMQSWRNFTPSQQQNMLGSWEAQGWNKDDVTSLMNQSLPRYASNAPTAGTFRLR